MFEDRLNSEEREFVPEDCPNFAESAEQNESVPFLRESLLVALNPEERELESALRMLRPAPVRFDVADAAMSSRRRNACRFRLWPVAAAAAAVLLGVSAWLVLPWGEERSRDGFRPVALGEHDRDPASEIPAEPPTLLVYRRALAGSPDQFESLLDRQARAGTASQNGKVTLTAWKADLHSSLGEM
jgi:hypothetical protein